MLSDAVLWFVIVGLLLATMGTIGPLLKKTWISASIIYLIAGWVVGPTGLSLMAIDWVENAVLLEHLTEIAVIVSLYSAGMKIRLPLAHRHWVPAVILASATMLMTVALTAVIASNWLGLPIGFAVLLGAVLAPTDPVLAAEVQVEHPDDDDTLRRTLTGEAGLNDGTAFPVVLLAIGLIDPALHDLGAYGLRWLGVDVLYKVTAGLILGYAAGYGLAKLALWLRQNIRADIASDEMLTLGFIALIYGIALAIDCYAFLSVFTAALAMRRVEMSENDESTAEEAIEEAEQCDAEQTADAPEHAAAMLTRDTMIVADTMERLAQIVLVLMVGMTLSSRGWLSTSAWIFAAVMVIFVRPLATMLTCWTGQLDLRQKGLVAWFGIRGIGTFYYLTHAIGLGASDADPTMIQVAVEAALATVTLSIVIHGISVTPLMKWYDR